MNRVYWDQPGWVGCVFTCPIGNQPFSVGLVDQLFPPTRNPVENDGYSPLSQSWALICCVIVVTKLDTSKSDFRERTGTEWLVLGLGWS